LVVVVLAVAGVFSGGSSSASTASTSSTSASSGTTSTPAANAGSQLPQGAKNAVSIPLKSVGGAPGSGVATLAASTQDQPFLDLQVNNLPPPQNGDVYAAWLVLDTAKRQGYPLAPLVPYNQPFHNDYPIPTVAVPLIAGIHAIDITATSATKLRAEIKTVIQNPKHPKLVLPEIGHTVLRGVVPRGKGSAAAAAAAPGSGG
jgi:hypothetical protein